MATESKTCAGCGATFERPPGVSPARWAARSFCSRACGARVARIGRYDDQETKDCQVCGRTFARKGRAGAAWAAAKYCSQACTARARSEAAWATRPSKTCPVCGTEFRVSPAFADVLVTCGDVRCKSTYRREVVAPKIAASVRAGYASGKRKPGKGVSAREVDLWPLLRDHGWVWRLRWFEPWGSFEMDFAHFERKLNVEIDGEEHRWPKGRTRDEARDGELERRGWGVLRITNEEVDADPVAVAERIAEWAAVR